MWDLTRDGGAVMRGVAVSSAARTRWWSEATSRCGEVEGYRVSYGNQSEPWMNAKPARGTHADFGMPEEGEIR
jgi:hypothetical protein